MEGDNTKIKDILIGKVVIPLKNPFITALRTVNVDEEIVIKILADDGNIGYGSATSTAVITGDIENSIVSAIKYITPMLIDMEIENLDKVMEVINKSIVNNTSAKAALDMAIYDLFCKRYKIPLYKLLGGYDNSIATDITISLNSAEKMVTESLNAIRNGYDKLKIKVGLNPDEDILRIQSIFKAVPSNITIRIDANQGWTPKQAVRVINKLKELNLNIELVEQPVKGWDIDGLKFVTDNVDIDILADESVFNKYQAFQVIKNRSCDLINIKLMKCGGIYNALNIYNMCETVGIDCMMGCMIESKIGITAAASLAVAKRNITKADLDTMLLFSEDPVVGGAVFEKNKIILPDEPGLGIKEIKEWKQM